MLPDFIINEIKKREREKECADEWFIECPVPEDEHDSHQKPATRDPKSSERGVAVIDFTI
jgi:hypothetical protein